jgi:hypothetical protein
MRRITTNDHLQRRLDHWLDPIATWLGFGCWYWCRKHCMDPDHVSRFDKPRVRQ